jgi:hypothetical protein
MDNCRLAVDSIGNRAPDADDFDSFALPKYTRIAMPFSSRRQPVQIELYGESKAVSLPSLTSASRLDHTLPQSPLNPASQPCGQHEPEDAPRRPDPRLQRLASISALSNAIGQLALAHDLKTLDENLRKCQRRLSDARDNMQKSGQDNTTVTDKLANLEKELAEIQSVMAQYGADRTQEKIDLKSFQEKISRDFQQLLAHVSSVQSDFISLCDKVAVVQQRQLQIEETLATIPDHGEGFIKSLDSLMKQDAPVAKPNKPLTPITPQASLGKYHSLISSWLLHSYSVLETAVLAEPLETPDPVSQASLSSTCTVASKPIEHRSEDNNVVTRKQRKASPRFVEFGQYANDTHNRYKSQGPGKSETHFIQKFFADMPDKDLSVRLQRILLATYPGSVKERVTRRNARNRRLVIVVGGTLQWKHVHKFLHRLKTADIERD